MASVKVNPDLQKERNNASFNPLDVTYILDGCQEFTERRRELEELVWNDKEIQNGPNYHFMSRSELYDEGIRKMTVMIKRINELGLEDPADLYYYKSKIFPNENNPGGLHTGMFLQALENLGHEELKAKWLQKAYRHEILGTYAQTELGHGTFLRGLETTATYDPKTEEFILHSPTLTSTKWWPGGLGKTSNFAVVMASLFINGKSYGMQGFLVQLRSLDTHEPLPGITLGDIGPKHGYNMIDNGFLRLNHVRVPRENMLAKNAEVLKDGTLVNKGKNSRLNYGTMVFVRAMIIWDVSAKSLAQAATIATRYTCVRRQSEMEPGQGEPQVLDFLTVQERIFPWIATAYAYYFAGMYIRNLYFMVNGEIQEGNVDLLPELHALSSGLKAYCTATSCVGIEELRIACGGHGYSLASGFTKIYVNAVAACTYEGENNVMSLQCARYLVKAYGNAQAGQKLKGSVKYLSNRSVGRCTIGNDLSLRSIVSAMQHRAARLVERSAKKYTRLLAEGKPQHIAWNLSSVQLSKAAMAHIQYHIVEIFVRKLLEPEDNELPDSALPTITGLCRLYALNLIGQNSGDFLEDEFMTPTQLQMLEEEKLKLLPMIRRDAVSLTDAFDFHDNYLQSVLGRYDGNVYENLYKWAQSSPLNDTEVHESYRKYLRPLQQEMAKSKL